MNVDTKRHIDAARQVLVGVVPNPTSQIDQITNALIYKFMDDMDQSVIKIGGKATFFTGDLERYSWVRVMDYRIGSQERMNLYSEALIKFSQAKQLPQLFRDIFKLAILPYRSPEVLDLFLREINYFDYSHSEELGNAFEYLLSIMGSQGDAGQFRTPRHIIEFIVDVVNPTKDDKVLDPACGTAGFLISAYKHILEQHDGKNDPDKKEKLLTPEQKKSLTNNFIGYDISPEMVRLSRVNMYLHNFKEPQIIPYNTLADQERWNDKFDVILANPPFMSARGSVRPHNKFSVDSNKAEVLFVDYITNHLRPKGRAGIIVPEGIIFQSGSAYKDLRKNLVEDGLFAVVSLPSGVFNPYAGVKTSILLFDNEIARQRTEILFVKVENDGFDLGAQRRAGSKNDLPQALDVLKKWKIGKKVEDKLVVYVEKSKIAESGDYNLSGDRYRVAKDYSDAKWPMVGLGEVCELHRGVVYSKLDEVSNDGYKILRANNISLDDSLILNDIKLISKDLKLKDSQKLKAGDIFICLASGSKDHVGKVAYINEDTDFYFGGFMGAVRIKKETISSAYLFHLLKDQKFNDFLGREISGVNINNLNFSILSRYQIPLPPLEIQEQIVAELDGYAGIIAGAKQIAQNWKPKIDINSAWDKVNIGSVAKVQGGFAFKSQEMIARDGSQIIKIGNVKDQKFDYQNNPSFIDINLYNNYPDYQLAIGDILISMTGTAGKRDYGNVCIVDVDGKFLLNQRVGRIVPKINILNKYLFFVLNQEATKDLFYSNATGGVRQGNISNKQIELIEIPLPPLAVQGEVVEKIEVEHALVESAKKLIEIYEQKTKEVIAKLWSE